MILPQYRPRLYEYIGGIIRTDKGIMIGARGTDNHMHVLGHINKNMTIPDSIKNIKSVSTGWVHETFPELRMFSWQGGYAAFTVSRWDIPKIKSYIENQEEHHRTVSFQEELIMMLEEHGVEYDLRYLWD